MADHLLLSIDGGGTKTAVSIARRTDDGSVELLGKAFGGPSNLTSLGSDPVIAELQSTITAAIENAGLSLPTPEFHRAIVALAGAADRKLAGAVENWLRETFCDKAEVMSDAEFVLRVAESKTAAGGGAVGLLVGTGSVAFARQNPGAETMRAGGWGPVLGDDGSGYSIGREAIRSVLRAADEETQIPWEAKVFEAINVSTHRELIRATLASQERIPAIASLARIVLASADSGDANALTIVEGAAASVGKLANRLLERMQCPPKNVVVACAGSMVTRSSVFKDRVEAELHAFGVEQIYSMEDPALEAIHMLARF